MPRYRSKCCGFTNGDALFIVLEASRLFHDKDSQAQINFVKNALAVNSKKWVIVVARHPYVSNGQRGNAGSHDWMPSPKLIIYCVILLIVVTEVSKQNEMFELRN